MPQKRSPSNGINAPTAKQIKSERPEEFSEAVRKRLTASSRTGQACDRCKVCGTKIQVSWDSTQEEALIVSIVLAHWMCSRGRKLLALLSRLDRKTFTNMCETGPKDQM